MHAKRHSILPEYGRVRRIALPFPALPRTIADGRCKGKDRHHTSGSYRISVVPSANNMPVFREPTAMERAFNRLFGLLVGMGFGLKHNYLLEVRGRKSGKMYSTPVNVLEFGGKRYLVAPRGRTQWVRNAEAAGEVALKKGSRRESFRLRAIADHDKPPLLKAYLDSFKTTVQRYFPIPAGSDAATFAPIAANYPVFELTNS